MPLILGIESSCDETAVSVIKDGKILSNVISSQISTFVDYGGVVPEIASRLHEQNFPYVLSEAVKVANIDLNDIDAVAVTNSPGLIGCLHIGLQVAKTIALNFEKKIIGINHIESHIYAANIENTFHYPAMALVISGGHTELVLLKNELDFEIIGQTIDDAIGETYDKVARVLELPYPGGPEIDKLAKSGKPTIEFPISNLDGFNFSYSGLKSAVINFVHNKAQKGEKIEKSTVACSFQYAAVQQLLYNTVRAIEVHKPKQLIICGGVSANSEIRRRASELKIDVLFPKMEYCTDNAAMVAKLGELKFEKGLFDDLGLSAKPTERIGERYGK